MHTEKLITILSKISLIQKDKYYMFSLPYRICVLFIMRWKEEEREGHGDINIVKYKIY